MFTFYSAATYSYQSNSLDEKLALAALNGDIKEFERTLTQGGNINAKVECDSMLTTAIGGKYAQLNPTNQNGNLLRNLRILSIALAAKSTPQEVRGKLEADIELRYNQVIDYILSDSCFTHVSTSNRQHWTPLMMASYACDTQLVSKLIDSIKEAEEHRFGWAPLIAATLFVSSPLSLALDKACPNIVELLLATVESESSEWHQKELWSLNYLPRMAEILSSAMLFAQSAQRDGDQEKEANIVKGIELLVNHYREYGEGNGLSKGRLLRTYLPDGSTLLTYAIVYGHPQVTKMLLEICPKNTAVMHPINASDGMGDTPLIRAVRFGETEIVELILKNPQVDLTLTDHSGKTALDHAYDRVKEKLTDSKRIFEVIETHLSKTRSNP